MYGYISGTVKEIDSNYIIIDNNGIGYLIYVPNPYVFIIGKEYTVYTYSNIREDEYTLYGFKTREEKELFLKLISVKGLGPKMALPMLATGSTSLIEEAIETENINYLKKFPKIGDKVARQVILDLKGKLNVINGELRTVTRLMEFYNIPMYKTQFYIYRIFNKLKLASNFSPLYFILVFFEINTPSLRPSKTATILKVE